MATLYLSTLQWDKDAGIIHWGTNELIYICQLVIMNSRTFQVILYKAPVVLHIREDCQWSQWILSATNAFDGAKSCPMHIVMGPEPVEITNVSRKFT